MTNQNNIFQQLLRLLQSEWPRETAAIELTVDTPLFYKGIGLDSVDGVTLLLALEETFQIEIPQELLSQDDFSTIGTLTSFILQFQPID